MSEELKPCPACGARQNVEIIPGQVVCWDCLCHGSSRYRTSDAIKDWNALPRRLRWTTEPPKKPGWYWWRWCKGAELNPLYVRDGLIVEYPRQSLTHVAGIGGEWAGPIPEPEE